MNIIFMGTPDFAVPCLARLIEEKYNIVGVFTQPDKPKGRGHKLAFPPVKELAVFNQIEVFQPKSLRNDEAKELIQSLNPDLIVVVAYGKILPKAILDIPKYGCINVHGSLLPKYRGAGPIQWSVLNGETVTGVTTMYMGEGIDTGDMLLKAETPIGENETASELYDRVSLLGAEVLSETLIELKEGRLNPIKQDDTKATHAPMLSKEMSNIDFSKDAKQVHNLIRGLSDWPCAITCLQGKRLKIYKSEIVAISEKAECGSIIDNKNFIVACGNDTAIKLVNVQYDNSKRMSGADFLRGKQVPIGEKLTAMGV
ncbi:MAG: methionyl-tRNA formyltransferase [Oscillospiraceae bacterium]